MDLQWVRRTDDDLDAPKVQSFVETLGGVRAPLQQFPDITITVHNTVPGKAYRVREILPQNSAGDTWSTGFSYNDYKDTYYWPVSNLSDEAFTRDQLVSNVNFYPHHSKMADDRYALRVLTRPTSIALQGDNEITFGLFLESNIDPVTTIPIGVNHDAGNVYSFVSPENIELGYVYNFDNSNFVDTFPMQLVDEQNNLLASADSNGVLTVLLDDPGLIGQNVFVQEVGRELNNTGPPMRVRDGRGKKYYTEPGNISFNTLFSNRFRQFVFEANVDSSYDRYDVFVTMRSRGEKYVTSHKYSHTIRPMVYAAPNKIAIEYFEKTDTDAVRFEYRDDYTVGLVFRLVKDVSLQTMYQKLLYS